MKILLTLIFTFSWAGGQEMFESFDLESTNRYVGKTTYEFDIGQTSLANRTLEMLHISGDIDIEGKHTKVLTVVEKMTIKSSSGKKARILYKENKAKVFQAGPGQIKVLGSANRRPYKTSFKYYITVPSEYNISARSSGGDISLYFVTGETDLQTSGGDLIIKNANGKIFARTAGGDILIDDTKGLVNLKTSGGDIEISNCDGKIDASTAGGSIEVNDCQAEISVQTNGGNIDLKSIIGSSIYARTMGGDVKAKRIEGDLKLITYGGYLNLEDITGYVEAKTYAGDIELDNIKGAIEISTGAGDIEGKFIFGAINAQTDHGDIEIEIRLNQKIESQDITLITDHGSILLVLPEDFSATIDALVEDNFSDGTIESDFPLKIFMHRGDVRAEGTIHQGKSKIKLRSNNNSIMIEKE